MFIELTIEGRKLSINLDYISDFGSDEIDGKCTLVGIDGSEFEVDESYEQVKEKIERKYRR